MLFIQILLLLFFLFAALKVVGRFRAGELPGQEMLVWLLLWIAAGVVVATPNSTFYLARIAGVGRGADLVVYVALAGLFFMIFRLMVRIEKINKEVTKLTRKIALSEKVDNDKSI